MEIDTFLVSEPFSSQLKLVYVVFKCSFRYLCREIIIPYTFTLKDSPHIIDIMFQYEKVLKLGKYVEVYDYEFKTNGDKLWIFPRETDSYQIHHIETSDFLHALQHFRFNLL